MQENSAPANNFSNFNNTEGSMSQ